MTKLNWLYCALVLSVFVTVSSRVGRTEVAAQSTPSSEPHNIVRKVPTVIERRDRELDRIVAPDAKIEQLAEGFQFTEGPVWRPQGDLLFSDVWGNRIYRWQPDQGVSLFRDKSGYSGADVAEYKQPGSNGLTFDAQGRLTINEHGNRRVTRLEPNGTLTVLADRFEGKRLNSPNDLIYKSDGSLYFTDIPGGLPQGNNDPRKELPWNGVFRLNSGKLQLLTNELRGPNGLVFSPDERFLYIGDSSTRKLMRYAVKPDGTLGDGAAFFDMSAAQGKGTLDGMKADQRGNLYVTGPGGLWIISPQGVHLGTIKGPEVPANCAWGDRDGRTLYLTAEKGLYRIRLNVGGPSSGRAPLAK